MWKGSDSRRLNLFARFSVSFFRAWLMPDMTATVAPSLWKGIDSTVRHPNMWTSAGNESAEERLS